MLKFKTIIVAAIVACSFSHASAADFPALSMPLKSGDKPAKEKCDNDSVEKKWSAICSGFHYGWGGTNSGGFTSTSSEVGVMNVIGVQYRFGHYNYISLGAGYEAKFYKLKKNYCFNRLDDGVLEITDWDPTLENRKSSMTIHTIQFPLLYRKRFNCKLGLHAGVILDWNVYCSYTNKYKVGKTTISANTSGLKQNKVTVDFMAGISFKALGIYARFTPCKVFKNGWGPEMKNTWTLGLTLGI